MTQSEKDILHFAVIANTAHKIEKIARELSSIYNDSFLSNKRIQLKKDHLAKYFNELNDLMQTTETEQQMFEDDCYEALSSIGDMDF